MTLSICGFDPVTGELGCAVQSKFLAVGAMVPWGQANVGMVATQSWANTSFGPRGLKLLAEGHSPQEVIDILLSDDESREFRQVGIINSKGEAAAFTGSQCFDYAGNMTGPNFTCQGNILAGPQVVEAMAKTFTQTGGDLASRLIKALEAGTLAGGDRRGKQSAALCVVKEKGGYGGFNDRYIDLRVDDHVEPVQELIRLHELHQLYFYKTKPENLLKVDDQLFRELLNLLKLWGHFDKDLAKPDAEFWEAVNNFHLMENFDERMQPEGFIDLEVLQFMRKKSV